MPNPWLKPMLISVFTILMVGILAFQWNRDDDPYSVKNRNDLYQALIERSGILNRDLPKLIDMNTRFERAEVVDYGMRYIYSLVKVDRYLHDIPSIQAQVEPVLTDYYCTLESMAFYRTRADHFTVRYLDRQGAILFELRLTPSQC